MGVSRKAGVGSQGERQSKVVEQFAAGFVASSSATDAEKATQRDWDRSQLLAVKDDDAPVYDEVLLEEMEFVEDDGMYYYQCPCGDMFELSKVRASPRASSLCGLSR